MVLPKEIDKFKVLGDVFFGLRTSKTTVKEKESPHACLEMLQRYVLLQIGSPRQF